MGTTSLFDLCSLTVLSSVIPANDRRRSPARHRGGEDVGGAVPNRSTVGGGECIVDIYSSDSGPGNAERLNMLQAFGIGALDKNLMIPLTVKSSRILQMELSVLQIVYVQGSGLGALVVAGCTRKVLFSLEEPPQARVTKT